MASENERHSKIPIFSNREDFEDWIFDVSLWMGTTGRKKEEQAPALLLAQSVAEVKKVMRLVGTKYQMKKREARSYVSDVDDESANVAFAGFAERESAPALHL